MAESRVRKIRPRTMCWVGVWLIVFAVTAGAQVGGQSMKFVPRLVAVKTYVILSAEKPGLDGD